MCRRSVFEVRMPVIQDASLQGLFMIMNSYLQGIAPNAGGRKVLCSRKPVEDLHPIEANINHLAIFQASNKN